MGRSPNLGKEGFWLIDAPPSSLTSVNKPTMQVMQHAHYVNNHYTRKSSLHLLKTIKFGIEYAAVLLLDSHLYIIN